MTYRTPPGYSPPGKRRWTSINGGREAIRSEVAASMGIRPGQCIRGPVLVTARVKTNAINREDKKC
jgi:hypothetical protein